MQSFLLVGLIFDTASPFAESGFLQVFEYLSGLVVLGLGVSIAEVGYHDRHVA